MFVKAKVIAVWNEQIKPLKSIFKASWGLPWSMELVSVSVKPWDHPPPANPKYHASCLLLISLRRRWMKFSQAQRFWETIKHMQHFLQITLVLSNTITEWWNLVWSIWVAMGTLSAGVVVSRVDLSTAQHSQSLLHFWLFCIHDDSSFLM